MDPGCSLDGSPITSCGAPPVEMPCRGSSPSCRNWGANCSRAPAVKPLKERGVDTSLRRLSPIPVASCGRALGSSASFPKASQLGGWIAFIHLQHFLYGPNAGDGILGVWICERYRADQFAIDVNRAAAHPLHDAGMFQRAAGQPGQDDILPRADIFQHTQDFHLKILDLVAGKDGFADAMHAGPDIAKGHNGQRSRSGRGYPEGHPKRNGRGKKSHSSSVMPTRYSDYLRQYGRQRRINDKIDTL